MLPCQPLKGYLGVLEVGLHEVLVDSILAAGALGLVCAFQENQLSVPLQNLAMQVKSLQFKQSLGKST